MPRWQTGTGPDNRSTLRKAVSTVRGRGGGKLCAYSLLWAAAAQAIQRCRLASTALGYSGRPRLPL